MSYTGFSVTFLLINKDISPMKNYETPASRKLLTPVVYNTCEMMSVNYD